MWGQNILSESRICRLRSIMAILGLVCVPLVWQNLFWYGWNSEAFIRMMPSKRVLRQAEEDIKSYKQLALNLDCQDNSSYNDPRFKSAARDFLTNSEIVARCSNCSEYFEAINSNGFAQTTTEELETPLAFAYTVHKDIGILEAFLSLYFRPMDAHCIHVDAKADMGIYKTVQSIVRCYNEVFPESLVFISRQSIPVFWGKGGSMMEADIICYRELVSRSNKWKYVSNVAGTELPFVSIQRFRQKLRDANGNSIRITRKKFPHRHNHIYEIMRNGSKSEDFTINAIRNRTASPKPCGIEVFKGFKNGAFTTDFIRALLSNPFLNAYYSWLAAGKCPEEHLTATLATLSIQEGGHEGEWRIWQRLDKGVENQNYPMINDNSWIHNGTACYKEYAYFSNNGTCHFIEGKCPGKIQEQRRNAIHHLWTNGVCYRSTIWGNHRQCNGKIIRDICNFGVEDLPKAKEQKCLIGNKFDLSVDVSAVWCQYKEINEWTRNYDPARLHNGL